MGKLRSWYDWLTGPPRVAAKPLFAIGIYDMKICPTHGEQNLFVRFNIKNCPANGDYCVACFAELIVAAGCHKFE